MRDIKFRVWTGNSMWSPEFRTNWEMLKDAEDEPHPTIMQYTGLKDKNGVEIYEGDVVEQLLLRKFGEEANPRMIGEVKFDSTAGYRVGSEGIWPHDCEVIGNIYENPELLAPTKTEGNKE